MNISNECIGYINSKSKPTLSTKYPILSLNGMHHIKKFIKTQNNETIN